MEPPYDDPASQEPPGMARSWQKASPLLILLHAVEERPDTWDLALL